MREKRVPSTCECESSVNGGNVGVLPLQLLSLIASSHALRDATLLAGYRLLSHYQKSLWGGASDEWEIRGKRRERKREEKRA